MKAALVTGASRGIGLAISKKLVKMGYKVYGLARDFSSAEIEGTDFIRVVCDITDTNSLLKKINEIKNSEDNIHIVVNNAGVGYFGPHEQLKPSQIEKMVLTNLQAPLILTNLLLRELKKNSGYIINISSITAKKSSTHGCAYCATKAGLSHFSTSLFDEVRKSGVKVVAIHPDITASDFYNHADFTHGEDPLSYITPECIADAIENILLQREGTLISEITIRPQKHAIERKKQT